MLVARAVERVIREGELILHAAQAPDNLARIPIDFGDLTDAAAGKENVAIGIDINGIHVREVETAAVDINELLLAVNVDIVPRPPLENEIAGRRKTLNDLFGNRGGRISSHDITAHIHSLGTKSDQEV